VVFEVIWRIEATSGRTMRFMKRRGRRKSGILFVVVDKDVNYGWAPVAHTCHPSYSGGRDQENCSLKLAQANNS
jgi:hypothetical protein